MYDGIFVHIKIISKQHVDYILKIHRNCRHLGATSQVTSVPVGLGSLFNNTLYKGVISFFIAYNKMPSIQNTFVIITLLLSFSIV